jgi:phospholipid-binding lipoprotein MlaA
MKGGVMGSLRGVVFCAVALACVLLPGCGPPARHGSHAVDLRPDYDPIEPVNRRVFWFNDKLDTYVLEPVATGWDRIAPDPVQRSVSNFFSNLRFPIFTVNDVLQGKVNDGAVDVGRFAVNTTVGVLGFFDPATRWGFAQHNEDFGQTLGWWGVRGGPYLVLPVLGPSSVRETVGLVGDSAASITPFFVNGWILAGARAVDTINYRSLILEQVREAKRASFDYYSFVRNAYVQRRNALLHDNLDTNEGEGDALYHPELQEE